MDEMKDEGSPMFALDGANEEIGSRVLIDIYVLSENAPAKLRTDLP